MDDAYALLLSVLDVVYGALSAVYEYFSGFRLVYAAENFDERRFSGAIFAYKGVYGTLPDLQLHV